MEKALKPFDEFKLTIGRMEPEISKALPAHVSIEKFTRTVVTAVQRNPKLLEVNRQTLWDACLAAASDGLLPDGRESAIVPFKDRAQYMTMVRGLKKLARNSGEISTIAIEVVKENDSFSYEAGDNPHIHHVPAMKNRGETIGAYSIVKLKDGEICRCFMNREEIDRIRARSKKADDGPWVTDFEEMACKTVFRRHSKNLPTSTDLERALDREFSDMPVPEQPTLNPISTSPKRLTALVQATKSESLENQASTTEVMPDGQAVSPVTPI